MELIIDEINKNLFKKQKILIGISGIPGSGKSTFSEKILNLFPEKTIIIPLDGFHKYLSELNQDQIKFRGRIDTFDLKKFKEKFDNFLLFDQENFFFPSFDHKIKDPIENDIKITKEKKIIIFEGLYLFVKELNISNFFDIKIFMRISIEKAMDRVAIRNFNAGIVGNYEDSIKRADFNDKINAFFVLENSDFSNVIYID